MNQSEEKSNNEIKMEKVEDMNIKLENLHHSIDIKKEVFKENKPYQDFETQICNLFECGVCNAMFTDKSSLREHVTLHTEEDKFFNRTALRQHLKLHSASASGVKQFSCEICYFKCKQPSTLKIHSGMHTGEKSYACEVCDYKASNKSTINMFLTKQFKNTNKEESSIAYHEKEFQGNGRGILRSQF